MSQSTVIPENFIYFCLVRVLVIVSAVEGFCDAYTKMHSSQSDVFLENHLNSKDTVKSYQLFEQDGCTVEGEKGNDTLSNFDLDLISCISRRFSYYTVKKKSTYFFHHEYIKVSSLTLSCK